MEPPADRPVLEVDNQTVAIIDKGFRDRFPRYFGRLKVSQMSLSSDRASSAIKEMRDGTVGLL